MILPRRSLLLALFLAPAAGFAQREIVKSGDPRLTMDWSQVRGGGEVAAICQQDLIHSGCFMPGGPNAEYRFVGVAEGGSLSLRVFRGPPEAGQEVFAQGLSGQNPRQVAHAMADRLVEKIARQKGIAQTRFVLTGRTGRAKELYLCDYDGANLRALTRDGTVNLGPRWTPRGDQVYYTSYLKTYPDLYRVDLSSGARERVASFPGLNTGGALSPDGRSLALVLSKDGRPEIYVMDVGSKRTTRVTNSGKSAKASPSWSPDGSQLVYVSGETGKPQLFVVSRTGGAPSSLALPGAENVSPDWGPNGEIAFCLRQGGRYQIALTDPRARGSLRVVSPNDGFDYEEPSWAPNGRHVVATRSTGGRSELYVLDTKAAEYNARTPAPPVPMPAGFKPALGGGEYRSADWSP
jgi:TolB protein